MRATRKITKNGITEQSQHRKDGQRMDRGYREE